MIIAAMDPQYTAQLYQEYVGLTNKTIRITLEHAQGEWCKVTTSKRTEALANSQKIWELDENVKTFSLRLDKNKSPAERSMSK